MELEFQIDHIFENITRHGPHLIARKLTKDGDFKLTETLTLGGYGITFDLKDKSELSNFEKGQIVKLIE